MKIPVVYIAGKFRGPTAWDIEKNIRRAEEVGLEVAKAGGMPLIPHANTRYFHGQLPDEFWIKGTLELLARCDLVVLVPGWETSEGTLGEVAFAEEHEIPTYTLFNPSWRSYIIYLRNKENESIAEEK